MWNYETIALVQEILSGKKSYEDLKKEEKRVEALSVLCFVSGMNYLKISPRFRTQQMFEIALDADERLIEKIPDDEMTQEMRDYAVRKTNLVLERFSDLTTYEMLHLFERDPMVLHSLPPSKIQMMISEHAPAFHTICMNKEKREYVNAALLSLFNRGGIGITLAEDIISVYPEFIGELVKTDIFEKSTLDSLLSIAVFEDPNVLLSIDPKDYTPPSELVMPFIVNSPGRISELPEEWVTSSARLYARALDKKNRRRQRIYE